MPTSQALVTGPTAEPLTLADLKRHLKIEADDTREDGFVLDLLKAARERVEVLAGRALMAQQWDYWLDNWPSWEEWVAPAGPEPWASWPSMVAPIFLPIAPVLSVDEIAYTQVSGAPVVWASANYVTDLSSKGRARILPAGGLPWPTAALGLQSLNAVKVRFTAGYAMPSANVDDQRAAVPEIYRQAIRLQVAHWFVNRDGTERTAPEVMDLLGGGSSLAYA